jgi:hypothetical protein
MNLRSSWRLVAVLALLPLALSAEAARPDSVPLKHWAAPLYYQMQTPHTESGIVSTVPLSFVAIPPCRVADTRSGSGYPALGSSPLAALVPATLPIAGSCGTPSSPVPLAYSLNVTVIPPAGTPGGYLTVYPNPVSPVPLAASLTWTAAEAFDTNAVVVESSLDGSVNIVARYPTDVVVDINGYYIAQPSRNASLVFDANALAAYPPGATWTVLETTLSASALVLPVTAWGLATSETVHPINLMLTFNAPVNFDSAASSAVLHVHYLTGPSSSPPSGTVNLDVLLCSAPAVTNFSGACFATYAQAIATSDAALEGVYSFNHYDVAYAIGGYSDNGHVISPGDFVAVTIVRNPDSFSDVIYLTSVEFNYPTN